MPVVLQSGDVAHTARHASHMHTVSELCVYTQWQCIRVTVNHSDIDHPWCSMTLKVIHIQKVLHTIKVNGWLIALDNDITIVRIHEAFRLLHRLMVAPDLHLIAQLNRDVRSNASSGNSGVLLVRKSNTGRRLITRYGMEQTRREWISAGGY